jgi:hypothetical protein
MRHLIRHLITTWIGASPISSVDGLPAGGGPALESD